MPGFRPADPQDLGRAQDAGLSQDIDSQTLKQRCESTMPFGPWELHLTNAVFITFDPWRASVEDRLELATIEMAPSPLLAVVIERADYAALGTDPFMVVRMLSPDIYLLVLCAQFYASD